MTESVLRQPVRPERPPATIVLATHARPAFLADCVASIAAAMSEKDELIVVECCNRAAAGLLGRLGVRVTHVSEPHAAKTVKLNRASRLARGEVILITDDDCRVPPGWVDAMARPFVNPAVGVAFGPVSGLSSAPGSSLPVIPPGPGPTELWFYAHGASMAVRRRALADVGGFDERFGPGASIRGGEEADLVLRLLSGGWTCHVADARPVEHLEWRDRQENMANVRVYQHGLGAYLGAALRRDARRGLKMLLLRLWHERVWWEDRRSRGWSFGPTMTLALARGVLTGVRIRPHRFLPKPPAQATRTCGKPKVLWVTDEPPDRNLGGGSIRQARLLERLADRFDVTVLLVGRLRDDAVRRNAAAVLELPAPRPERRPANEAERRFRDLWQAACRRRCLEVVATTRVRRVLAPVLDRVADEFDLVVVQHLSIASVLPAHRSGPWILEAHNVPSERARQERANTRGRRQRWLLTRQFAKALRHERKFIASYDGVIVVSEHDADALAGPRRERARGPVTVVPNGVDTDVLTATPLPPEPHVLLPASLNYLPNIYGAMWFCDEVLPRVQAKVPDVRFAIAGRQPDRRIVALADRPGVEVHADVPRMAPWLEWARVVVVPLHVGTGTRLKALEAMAAGRPVVGTSIGLEGLGIVDGVHGRIIDDAETMADAIAELLSSDAEANALAAEGRRHVEDHFQWQGLGERLAATLEAAARRSVS